MVTVAKVVKKLLVYLLFSFHKGISAGKNVLVTFSTKLVLQHLKNVGKVCSITSRDLLSYAFWSLNVFQLLSTRKLLLHETM